MEERLKCKQQQCKKSHSKNQGDYIYNLKSGETLLTKTGISETI